MSNPKYMTFHLSGGMLVSVTQEGRVLVQPAADDQQIADALRTALAEEKNASVLLSLGGTSMQTRVFEAPASTGGEELEALAAERLALDGRLNQIVTSTVAVAKAEGQEEMARVVASGGSRAEIQKLVSLIQATGGRPVAIEPAVISLARSAAVVSEDPFNAIVAVDIESDGVAQIAIVDQAGVKATRIVRGHSPVDPSQLASEVKATVERADVGLPGCMYLSGAVEDDQLQGILEQLNTELDFPAVANEAGGVGQRAAVCAGILMGWTQETRIGQLNLTKAKKERRFSATRAQVVTAAVAAFAIFAAGYWYIEGQREKSSQQELAAAEAKYQAVSGPAGIGPSGGVGSLVKQRENYEAYMAALAQLVQGSARLTSVTIGATEGGGEGNVIRLEGCGASQPAVAALVERAAKIPGITDANIERSGSVGEGDTKCGGSQVAFALTLAKSGGAPS